MERVLTKTSRCKQCGLCLDSCPTKSIKFSEELNESGYNYTIINHETCTACGICYTVCPDGVYEVLGDK